MYKVLIIDDLKSIYNKINQVLQSNDCEIDYCENGQEGLKSVEEIQYDLIILDIHMPDISGIEVCKQVKEIPAYKHIPILLLTSDDSNLENGLLAGAADYILKPFNEIEMKARVFTQLKLSKANQIAQEEKESLAENLKLEKIKLVDAQQDLQQYFYQAAHKLRAPICSMEGLLQLIDSEYPEISSNQYVKKLQRTVKDFAHINQQICKIGEIKSYSPTFKKINLNKHLQSFLAMTFPNEIFDLSFKKEIGITTDSALLKIGLKPIIENAMFFGQFTKSPFKEIKIYAEETPKNLLLNIEDNGLGMSDELIKKITEMFYIGNTDSKGNGLGLFISKTALEKLNIKLNFKVEENKFTIVQLIMEK